MALTVGELNVELDARTREFRAGLRQAERRLGRFEKSASRSTAVVGSRFRGLGKAIGVTIAAITALIAAFAALGLFRFISEGVKAAATFRSIAVSLEVLTGSAKGAADVLDEVNRLVVATPFGLRQTASAARSLSVIFGENTKAVAEFTGIAADLGAAFSKPIEVIGENLSRAFSAGLGSAEILRESGITPLILSIAGVSDVSKLTTEQFVDALRQLTEEGGRAFAAAAKQAAELEGALSNTSIAFENFRRAVGDVIADPLADFLVNILQPAFQALEAVVLENRDAIADFAERTLGFLGRKFGEIFQVTIDVLRALADLGDAFDVLRAIASPFVAATFSIVRVFILLITTIGDAAKAAVAGFNVITRAARFDFSGARESLGEFGDAFANIEDRFDKTAAGIGDDIQGVIDRFSDIGGTREALDSAADGLENLRERTAELAEAARDAPPVVRERADIDIAALPGTKKGDAEKEGTDFGELFASGFSSTFGKAIRGESVDFIADFSETLLTASEEALSDAFKEATEGLGGLLKSAVGASGIGTLFAEGGALGGIGTFFSEKLGKDAGQVLGGAALGILGAGIGALRKRDEARSTAANIASAVTSVQAVRGIVSGPTSIAVASVAPAIEDAFIEPTRLLALIEENTRRTARATDDTGTGSVPSGGTSEATQALASEGPSLV